jgi:pimeloyl-ACP methyl ester carboxylesterase
VRKKVPLASVVASIGAPGIARATVAPGIGVAFAGKQAGKAWSGMASAAWGRLSGPVRANDGSRVSLALPLAPGGMPQTVPNLRKLVMLSGCGHWTQQERPAEINVELLAFLKGLG